LAVVTAIGMFVVLVMGEIVTTTGSAQGCGRDWPLCKGQLVPGFAISTWIEFSHRFVTGIEGLLIVILVGLVVARHWDRGSTRVLAPLLLGSLLLQAGMGAWAVKYPQAAPVLALHFGFSLIALAAAALMAVDVAQIGRPRPAPVGAGLRAATWAFAAYLYVLIYSGAYVRHAGAAAACVSWPLCKGSPVMGSSADLFIDLAHRGLAGLALAGAGGLLILYCRRARGRLDLYRGAMLLIATLLLQGAAGAYLVMSDFSLLGELTHAAVTGLAFVATAYLCFAVSLGGEPAQRSQSSGQTRTGAVAGREAL
jgi:cytochrome c oxidase assembly protein subunit 15